MLSRMFGSKIAQVAVFVAYFIFTFFAHLMMLGIDKAYHGHSSSFLQLIQATWLRIIAISILDLVLATLIISVVSFGVIQNLLQAYRQAVSLQIANLALRIASLNYVVFAGTVQLYIIFSLLAVLAIGSEMVWGAAIIILVWIIIVIMALSFVRSSNVQILQNYQANLETKRINKFLMIPQIISIAISVALEALFNVWGF